MCDPARGEHRYTVAQVRLQPGHAEVMFYESARIYRLPREQAGFDETAALLRQAQASGAAVCVRTSADGVVARVRLAP